MAHNFDNPEDQERFRQMGEIIRAKMDPEELEFIIQMTYMLGVLGAIEESGSMDADTLANVLYEQKGHIIPVEEFKKMVVEQMPILMLQGLVTSEGLTPQGHVLAIQHLDMLRQDGQPVVGGLQ